MFRAVRDYDGSDTDKCINLQTGDVLSAVHTVDETWFIGHNDRTGETGAFPIGHVEEYSEDGQNAGTPVVPPGEGKSGPPPEKPHYANVSQSIQERILKEDTANKLDPITRTRTLSNKANTFDSRRFLPTKPENAYVLKLIKTPEKKPQSTNNLDTAGVDDTDTTDDGKGSKVISSNELFSKESTLQRSVTFEDRILEHSVSVPESTASWQESSFECSFSNESIRVEDKQATDIVKEDGTYHRFPKPSLDSVKARGRNLFKSDRGENKILKALFGAIAGVFIGGILFVVLIASFGYSTLQAGVIVIVVTIITSVSLALSTHARCIMALVFPNFFTGKGRTVILSIILGVLLSTPIANITHNAKETGNSMACIAELAINQTMALQRQLMQPTQDVILYIQNQGKTLKQTPKHINDAFQDAKDGLDKIDAQFDSVTNTVFDIIQQCKAPIVKLVNDCNKQCVGIITNPFCLSACKSLMSITAGCDQLSNIDASLQDIARDTRKKLDEAVDYFNVEMVVESEISGETNSSANTTQIKKDVNDDIAAKARGFEAFINVAKKFLSLSLVLIFLQSFWYIRNYLANDNYDNIYITKQFRKLDQVAQENENTTVLPLKDNERDVYVDTSTFKLNSAELVYCKTGLAQVLLHFILCMMIFIFDFSLYYILNVVRRYEDVELEASGTTRINVQVKGSGPVADFYKIMVQGINLDQQYLASLDLGLCLPKPSAPSTAIIPALVLLYMIALGFVLLRGYGMRCRRKISAYYYPEQERARMDYLHKKIRHKRVGFLKFIRQQIKSSHKENAVNERLQLSSWLRFRFPFLETWLPARTKLQCISCEQKESSFGDVKLSKCKGSIGGDNCEAVYCQECSQALNNACPLCTQDAD